MAIVRAAALASLAGLCGVAGWAAAGKVRIDAHARLAEAESLVALARGTREPAHFAAAGEAYVAVLRSWVPFDPAPAQAVQSLLGLLPSLAPRDAARLLDEAQAAIDSLAFAFVPLSAEREELVLRRESLVRPPPPPPGPGAIDEGSRE